MANWHSLVSADSNGIAVVEETGVTSSNGRPEGTLHLTLDGGSLSAGGATVAAQNTGNASLASLVTQTDGIEGSVDGIEGLLGGTGSIKDAGASWSSVFGVSGAAVVSADMTAAAAVTDAPTSGQKIVLTDIVISADTAMNVLIEEETSGTDLFKIFIPANGTVQLTPRSKMKLATVNKKVTAKASVAGNIAVTAFYFSEA